MISLKVPATMKVSAEVHLMSMNSDHTMLNAISPPISTISSVSRPAPNPSK